MRRKYAFICLSVFVVAALLLSSCTPAAETNSPHYLAGHTAVGSLRDRDEILSVLDMCYYSGQDGAGFHSIALTAMPNIQLLYDTVRLAELRGYQLSEDEIGVVADALQQIPPDDFYSRYLYHSSLYQIGAQQTAAEDVEQFVSSHYDKRSGLFFMNDPNESEIDRLTATYQCLELCALYGIAPDFLREVSAKITAKMDGMAYDAPVDLPDAASRVLGAEGTLVKAFLLYHGPEELDSRIKEWILQCVDQMAQSRSDGYSIVEYWVMNDLNAMHLWMNGAVVADFAQCAKDVYTHSAVLHPDMQYGAGDSPDIVEQVLMLKNYGLHREMPWIDAYISHMIRTQFRKYHKVETNSQDTYFACAILSLYDLPIPDVQGVERNVERWLRSVDFQRLDELGMDDLQTIHYALKLHTLLGMEWDRGARDDMLRWAAEYAAANLQTVSDGEGSASLHHLAVLTMIVAELDGDAAAHLSLPGWVDAQSEGLLQGGGMDVVALYDLALLEGSLRGDLDRLETYEAVAAEWGERTNRDETISGLQKIMILYHLDGAARAVRPDAGLPVTEGLFDDLEISDLFHLYAAVHLRKNNR